MAGRGQVFNAEAYNNDIRNAIAGTMMAQGGYQDPRFGQPTQAPEVPPLILTGPNVPSPLDPPLNRDTFDRRFGNPEDFQPSDPTMQPPRGDRLDREPPPEEREPLNPNNTRDFTDPIFDDPRQLPFSQRFPTNEETLPQRQFYTDEELGVRPQPPEQFPGPQPGEPPLQDFTPTFPYQPPQQQPQQPVLPPQTQYNPYPYTGLIGGADDFRGSPRGLDVPSRTSRLLGEGPYINQTFGRGRY